MLNFKITLPLLKLDMFGLRLVSNGSTFSDNNLVGIQLLTLLLLSNIMKQGTETIIIACKIHSTYQKIILIILIRLITMIAISNVFSVSLIFES